MAGMESQITIDAIKELIKSNSVAASIIYVLLEIAKVFI